MSELLKRSTETQMLETVSGERAFIMPIIFYKALYEALAKTVGEAVKSIMYYAGVRAGRAMARDAIRVRQGTLLRNNVEAVVEILNQMGIARMEKVEKLDGRLKLVIAESISRVLGLGEEGKARCHLERGVIAGMLEEMLGKEVIVKEVPEEEKEGQCVFLIEVKG